MILSKSLLLLAAWLGVSVLRTMLATLLGEVDHRDLLVADKGGSGARLNDLDPSLSGRHILSPPS